MDLALSDCFKALEYAAWQHRFQRRKGFSRIPYINHPIKVAGLLIASNTSASKEMIMAAILHDVVEDTDASNEDIIRLFGEKVASIVAEVTDDMSLPSKVRKEKQVEKAPLLSAEAKQIKIADKLCNINDFMNLPIGWSKDKKMKYILWAKRVAGACKGINPQLEAQFDTVTEDSLKKLTKNNKRGC